MKKKIYLLISIILLTFIYLTKNDSTALAFQPGSLEDPLITKSYLEERLLSLQLSNESKLSNEELNFIIEDITRSILSQGEIGGFNTFEPVNVTTGEVIIGDEGTEIILRSGSALVFTEVENGLVNITTGKEHFNGDRVNLNNKLIVPRNDGRGVLVTEDSWFIIRGNYTVH